MPESISSAQMRAIERAAIESGAVLGRDLMKRAGAGVVAAICAKWADPPDRAVILCGPGNNGGDGFVIAHDLARLGWQVTVFLYGTPCALPPDARHMYQRWANRGAVHLLGFPIPDSDMVAQCLALIAPPDRGAAPALVVDALFGIGLSRPLSDLAALFGQIAALRPRVVAVDLPSGLDADTGQPLDLPDSQGPAVLAADLTVTFHALKHGHLTAQGEQLCGTLRCVDIGLADRDSVAHVV
ncbi:MAG: NAD(P)H-hydrate epimerase [Roseinatronobacter sp.]